jgi:hypothetical protein
MVLDIWLGWGKLVTHRILVGTPLGRHKRSVEDNFKTGLREKGCEDRLLMELGSRSCPVAGCIGDREISVLLSIIFQPAVQVLFVPYTGEVIV